MSEWKPHRTFWWVTFWVFVDWITKFWVRDIYGGTRKLIPGVLHIETLRNRGVFQGWFSDNPSPWLPWIAMGVNLCFCGCLAWWALRTPSSKTQFHLGIACMIGGALGNTLDRAIHGYILDFLVMGPLGIYNLADFAILFGAILIVVHLWKNVP